MKKQIIELLSGNNTLDINDIFKLRHTTKDYEGKPVDWLFLETKSINGGTRYFKCIEIKSRETNGIMEEVDAGIFKIMTEIQENMRKRWNGGIVGRIKSNE